MLVRLSSIVVVAAGLLGMAAPAAGQPYAYVLAQRGASVPGGSGMYVVHVIDVATHARVTAVEIGMSCYCLADNALAVSRDGGELYVATRSADSVAIVSTATNSVIGAMGVAVAGSLPMAITVSPDNSRLYVVGGIPASVRVIDRASRTLITTVPLNVTVGSSIEVSPDGTRVYVTTWSDNSIKVLDTASNTVIHTIPTGQWTGDVALANGGAVLYATDFISRTLSIVDAGSYALLSSPSTVTNPSAVAVSPVVAEAFVGTSNRILVYNTLTHTQTTFITMPVATTSLAFTADGSRLLHGSEGAVRIVDPAARSILDSVPFDIDDDGRPRSIVTTPPPFTPPPNPPPTGLTVASVAGNLVTLRWTAPVGSTPNGYVVEGGVTPGQVLASLPTGATETSYRFTAPSGAFRVRVHALTAAGRSPASNEVPLLVNAAAPPSAPAGLLGLVNGTTLSLAWQGTFGGAAPTGYRLDVSGDLTTSLLLGPGEAFSFTGVPAGTYTFAVRALNAAGVSDPSNAVTLTFPGACSGAPAAPPAPSVLRAGRTLTVSWVPPGAGPAPTSFVLVVSGAFTGELPTAGRTLGGAVGPGSYTLRVRAVNPCGASADGEATTVIVP